MGTLHAYVPMDRRQALVRGETLPDRTSGAALFADISGFTPLTRALTQELGRKAGPEELLRQINPVYQALIVELHHYGGSVIGFAGDAITCWLDEAQGPAVPRAMACALAMQRAMRGFAHVRTAAGSSIALGIKVAVAAGPARRFVVGDPQAHLLEALAGRTLERMAQAEGQASTGEVVVSREVVDQLGTALVVAEWRGEGGDLALVERLERSVSPAPWPDIPADALSRDRAKPWVLPPVYARLEAGESFLGDLRPVTPLFLRFGGLEYDGDDQAGAKLDNYVRWVQAVVHRYGGSLVQLTIGDKGAYLYAVFGAPVAHEDDTGRALAAASELANAPPEWPWLGPVQIGISQGEVWTGACGAAIRHTYGVLGSEVNLAAHLMMCAPPGQILASASVGAHRGFVFALAGEVAGKGLAQAVSAYRLLGHRETEERFFPHPMVGRDTELRQLLDFAQPLFAGKLAGAALIYGEPGVGKSHLTFALQQALGDRVSWFTGQTDQVLRHPFNPFTYWLRRYWDQSADTARDENRARFEQRFARLLTDLEAGGADRALGDELVRVRSILGALVDLYWPDSLYERLDAQLRYQNTLFAVRTLLLAECCLRPVVLELEDGHWLDEPSHELLTVIGRDAAAYPLLIVITSRYADDGTRPAFRLAPDVPTTTLDLTALSPAALRQQAEELLGGPVDGELLSLLQERTAANPFFAQQVLLYFRENDWLAQTPSGHWGLASRGHAALADQLPATVNAILVARIDRLSQQVKKIVQTAAVLGREFVVQVLSQMLLGEEVLPSVQQAEREQIWTMLQELRCLFRHALLRDAAYDMQLRSRLRDLHRLAARAYETLYSANLSEHYGTLAYHYGQAGDEAQERRYAWLAGQAAEAQYANTEAARFFSRALELTPADDAAGRYDLLLARERVLDLQGQREAQSQDLAALEALAEVLGEKRRRAKAGLLRGRYADSLGDFAAAGAAVQLALHLAQDCGATDLEAEGRLRLGHILWRQGEYDASREQLERGLALSRAAQLPALEAQCLRNCGIVCWYRGDYAGVAGYSEQALAIERALGNREGESAVLGNLGLVAVGRGDYGQARDYFTRSLSISRELGDRFSESIQVGNLGALSAEFGDYATARGYAEQALRLCRSIGNRLTEAVNLGCLSGDCQRVGDYEEALGFGQQALRIGQEVGDRMAQGYGWHYVAQALAELGRPAEAAAAFQQALEIRRALGQHPVAMDCLAGLARLALAQGDVPQARDYVEEVMHFMETSSLEGTEEPMRVYLTCYEVLAAQGDSRSHGILERAHALLQERAARISDLEMRRSFLENVPAHREIVAAWRTGRCSSPPWSPGRSS